YGKEILPALMEISESSADSLATERANLLSHEINLKIVVEGFRELLPSLERNSRSALERDSFLLAQFGNPLLDIESYRRELDMLSAKLKERVEGIQSPFDILIAVNNFFFEEQKFK